MANTVDTKKRVCAMICVMAWLWLIAHVSIATAKNIKADLNFERSMTLNCILGDCCRHFW